MTAIGFIGLGAMGGRMATRLLEAGHALTVFNRTRERAEPLAAAGARVAGTPAEAARDAEVVITMVADPPALRAVAGGPDGVAAGIGRAATVIEMSTVGPAEVAHLAASLPEAVGLLDAPVLGSIPEAEAGTLRLFVGGPADLVARHAPLLETLGTVHHVGELGAGAAAKLVANSALFGALVALGESVAVGDALGLSRDATLAALAGTPLGSQAERRAPVLASDEPPAPRFTLSLARKDVELALAAAERDLPGLSAVARWLAQSEHAGLGAADYSAVLQTITRDSLERR